MARALSCHSPLCVKAQMCGVRPSPLVCAQPPRLAPLVPSSDPSLPWPYVALLGERPHTKPRTKTPKAPTVLSHGYTGAQDKFSACSRHVEWTRQLPRSVLGAWSGLSSSPVRFSLVLGAWTEWTRQLPRSAVLRPRGWTWRCVGISIRGIQCISPLHMHGPWMVDDSDCRTICRHGDRNGASLGASPIPMQGLGMCGCARTHKLRLAQEWPHVCQMLTYAATPYSKPWNKAPTYTQR